eukprot:6695724-Lingulodinium_polyedra.AAC.1
MGCGRLASGGRATARRGPFCRRCGPVCVHPPPRCRRAPGRCRWCVAGRRVGRSRVRAGREE